MYYAICIPFLCGMGGLLLGLYLGLSVRYRILSREWDRAHAPRTEKRERGRTHSWRRHRWKMKKKEPDAGGCGEGTPPMEDTEPEGKEGILRERMGYGSQSYVDFISSSNGEDTGEVIRKAMRTQDGKYVSGIKKTGR